MNWKHYSVITLGLVLAGLHAYKPALAPAIEGVATAVLVLVAMLVHKPGAADYIAELETVVEQSKKGGDK